MAYIDAQVTLGGEKQVSLLSLLLMSWGISRRAGTFLGDKTHMQGYLLPSMLGKLETDFHLFCGRYMHEICQPSIFHRNFKSANLLLDNKLEVRVSDCGLAPLLSSDSASKVILVYDIQILLA